jgi:hypothetical protein
MTTEEKLEKALADRDRFRDGWLARGRELNELYDVINEVAGDQGFRDPIADLRALRTDRDDWKLVADYVGKRCDEETLRAETAEAQLEAWQDAGRLQGA